jgi:hypothetical protein
MTTMYRCIDLSEEGRYCGSRDPRERGCYLCATCFGEAQAEGWARNLERVSVEQAENVACAECGARMHDAGEGPHADLLNRFLRRLSPDHGLESQYEDRQNGGLALD